MAKWEDRRDHPENYCWRSVGSGYCRNKPYRRANVWTYDRRSANDNMLCRKHWIIWLEKRMNFLFGPDWRLVLEQEEQ